MRFSKAFDSFAAQTKKKKTKKNTVEEEGRKEGKANKEEPQEQK
jgi:hypothetical protein